MEEPADTSAFRALHRLVERYTPDGTLGRTLLGGTALLLAPFLFFGGIAGLGTATNVAAFVMALLASVVSVPALFVGVLTLWPVYLSLIGNVASPGAYPDGASEPWATGEHERAEAVLKRRYAAGELTREEFERRLDAVLGASGDDCGESQPAERGIDERPRERARNR